VVQEAKLWCRPCSPHGPQRCPFGHHACMKGIAVERVLEAVQSVRAAAPAGR